MVRLDYLDQWFNSVAHSVTDKRVCRAGPAIAVQPVTQMNTK